MTQKNLDYRKFSHGSLFNGIGGFQLAAAWMGWENIMSCEIDDFCNKVTKHHFPNCIQHGDIKQTDFTIYRNRVDVLSGGFPCQPFSVAGEQHGEKHEQFLVEEMLRATCEIMPRWLVAENVYGITSKQFIKTLNHIHSSLENKGYQIQPYNIPATAVAANHERQRIYFIAYSGKKQFNAIKPDVNEKKNAGIIPKEWCEDRLQFELVERSGSSQIGFYNGNDFEPTIIRKDDGLSYQLDELEGLGNAIVPQIAYEIFKTIEQFELLTQPS